MNNRTSIFEAVCDPANLMMAWKQVRANKGAAGVDLVTITNFERQLQSNLITLSGKLLDGRYYPMPARKFEMKKSNGGTRTLAILTVEDRIVQRAMLNALEPFFEPAFSSLSFGFRPGRNVQMAVEQLLSYRASGDVYVLGGDITDLFGSLDHDLLMEQVSLRVRDKRVLGLLRMWLDCEQLLPSEEAAANYDGRSLTERLGDYATGAINSAVGNLMEETTGYGYSQYGGYPQGQFYGAAPTAPMDESAMEEMRRRARNESLKRLGRDGALFLLTSATKVRRYVSPLTLTIAGATVLAAAAYPMASRLVREKWIRRGGTGTLQGGSLSPLLANIYLHPFDQALQRHGAHLARYADDFVIAARDEPSAHAALELAARELQRLGLTLHPAKTWIRRFDQNIEWLGYRFHPHLVAAAPAPEDERLPLAAWWREAKDAIRQAPAHITPAATRLGERAKAEASARWQQLKTFARSKAGS